MRTLYVRNVPEEVVARLEQVADREGRSVNAVVVQELTSAAQRAANAELFDSLPDTGTTMEETLAALHAGREGR